MMDPNEKWITCDVLLGAAEMDTLIDACIEKYPPPVGIDKDLYEREIHGQVRENLKAISGFVANLL